MYASYHHHYYYKTNRSIAAKGNSVNGVKCKTFYTPTPFLSILTVTVTVRESHTPTSEITIACGAV